MWCARALELGIPTPTNRALQVMVKLAERARDLGEGIGYAVFRFSMTCLKSVASPR